MSKVVGKDLDPFDLILHVVFEQPPLTRKERVEKVRKRNYFSKYGEQAAEVLKSLLEKYAETGIEDWENFDILKVDPLKDYGTQVYIIKNIFGGREKYLAAVRELQNEIYVA